MTKREQLLASAVGLLVVAGGGNWLWGKYTTAYQQANDRVVRARDELGESELDKRRADQDLKSLVKWREKSLPRNFDVAQSQYRAWLLEQLAKADVKVDDVTPTGSGLSNSNYRTLPFSIDGQGTLESIVRFLWAFHSSDQLHKITLMQFNPQAGSKKLRLRINVEAIALTDADRDSGLNLALSDRLALADADQYIDTIVGRNLFADYVPPPPPPRERPPVVVTPRETPPPPPRFDDAKYAKVSAILESGGAMQTWILVDTTGERLRLKVGDEFEVGLLKGTINAIDEGQKQIVVLTNDDRLIAIKLGDYLLDGTDMTPGI